MKKILRETTDSQSPGDHHVLHLTSLPMPPRPGSQASLYLVTDKTFFRPFAKPFISSKRGSLLKKSFPCRFQQNNSWAKKKKTFTDLEKYLQVTINPGKLESGSSITSNRRSRSTKVCFALFFFLLLLQYIMLTLELVGCCPFKLVPFYAQSSSPFAKSFISGKQRSIFQKSFSCRFQ